MRTNPWTHREAVTMRTMLPALLMLLMTPCVAAQGGTEHDKQLKKRIDARIKKMREAIADGRSIITNVRVTVRLRNQYRVSGVVKDGQFIEKLNGLDFVDSDLKTPGAGIRVWYSDNTISYVFLPFDEIASYKIGKQLTQVEIEEIEDRIAMSRKERKERHNLARGDQEPGDQGAEPTASETDPEPEAAVAKATTPKPAPKVSSEEAELLALLDEFPPEAGWGEEKLQEIERSKIVVGVYPDDKSKRFLEVFSQWQNALRLREERGEGSPAVTGPRAGLPAKPGDPAPIK